MTKKLQKVIYFIIGMALFLQCVSTLYATTNTNSHSGHKSSRHRHAHTMPIKLVKLNQWLSDASNGNWEQITSEIGYGANLSIPSTGGGYTSDCEESDDGEKTTAQVALVSSGGLSSASKDIVQAPVYLNHHGWYKRWGKQTKTKAKKQQYEELRFSLLIEDKAQEFKHKKQKLEDEAQKFRLTL